ncbi:MAG: hypothetical protein D6702_02455 [Planctomycetota bacterium]|nr:MAG: hypothetical protein D6702_02455 [Planctomycetota bacterium]
MRIALLFALFPGALAPLPAAQQGGDEPAPIYDETADAAALIQDAVARAAHANKRVLIVWGGDWCVWCRRLHHTLERGELAREILYEYELVPVDSRSNAELASRYGADLAKGVPFLTVLDGRGRVLANQETGVFEQGEGHDPAPILNFLRRWEAPPLDAVRLYAEARVRAAREGKRILIRFGAPW